MKGTVPFRRHVGEKKVTVVLSAGGAVRSDRVTVLSDSIHLGRVTKGTNWKRHPWGSETAIARDSVREIRLENTRGHARVGGGILGATGAPALWFGSYATVELREGGSTSASLFLPTLIGAPLGGAVLGHWLGQRADRETTMITITDGRPVRESGPDRAHHDHRGAAGPGSYTDATVSRRQIPARSPMPS